MQFNNLRHLKWLYSLDTPSTWNLGARPKAIAVAVRIYGTHPLSALGGEELWSSMAPGCHQFAAGARPVDFTGWLLSCARSTQETTC